MSHDICAARWASCPIQDGAPHFCNRDPGHLGKHACGCGSQHMKSEPLSCLSHLEAGTPGTQGRKKNGGES
jgi:hypothetical protein